MLDKLKVEAPKSTVCFCITPMAESGLQMNDIKTDYNKKERTSETIRRISKIPVKNIQEKHKYYSIRHKMFGIVIFSVETSAVDFIPWWQKLRQERHA